MKKPEIKITIDKDRGFYKAETDIDELPEGLKLDELTEDRFDYLGEWMPRMKKEGYGMAHRWAIMTGFTDQDGDPMELHFHFWWPIATEGYKIGDREKKEMRQAVIQYAKEKTHNYSSQHRGISVFSITVAPPKYMLEELEKQLYDL
jgi:hypothetical protein